MNTLQEPPNRRNRVSTPFSIARCARSDSLRHGQSACLSRISVSVLEQSPVLADRVLTSAPHICQKN